MTVHGRGLEEIAWSTRGGDSVVQRCTKFAADNVYTVQCDPTFGSRVTDGYVRAYSAEGFTLVYALGVGDDLRTGVEIRDACAIEQDRADRVVLSLQLSGERKLSQAGKRLSCEPGSAVLFNSWEPYAIETEAYQNRVELMAFFIPSAYAEQRIPNVRRACGTPMVSGAQTFAIETLQRFCSYAWDYEIEDFYRSARAVADLILVDFGRGDESASAGRPGSAANLARAKSILRQRMADPDLALADVAQASGFSLNYMHKLFREEGTTPWAYLKAARLRSARELLQVARLRSMSITDVALSCGFSDSSYFSRSFRQAYGTTPREAMRDA